MEIYWYVKDEMEQQSCSWGPKVRMADYNL
jgi:hypothetical protein